MAEDPMRAKARATFGKTFMDAAKPQPLAKNAATASQKVANSRPIPTYKVGGVVKKAAGGVMPERIEARMKAGNYMHGGKVQTSADTARKLATEMGGMKDGGSCGMKPVKKAVGGAGKVRKDQAPIKKKAGGVAKKKPSDPVTTRPTGPGGRPATMRDLEQSNRDTGGMSADEIRRIGEAIGRGNRTPYEPIPRAKGGAAKVRKGMMTPEGDIKKAVKPKKGIGGFM
jgi:hypothetical protein